MAMILPYRDRRPRLDPSVFVAPGARIVGDVAIGADSSIWYNVVLRGDVNPIVVGARSNIQDGSVVHTVSARAGHPGFPTLIGDDVLIGHLAVVHGCTVEDRAFIGMGAIAMDGSVVESEAMLAAGALLTAGKRIPGRQLWAGRPAKFVRMLTDEELAAHRRGIERYVALAREHRDAVSRSEGPMSDD